MMKTLTEHEVAEDPAALSAAWESDESFFFCPAKPGVPASWLDSRLALVPPGYAQGHFALLTSGSTGLPKLVVGEKSRAEALSQALHAAQELEPVREAIVTLPLTYSYAFVNQWVWAHVHGRRSTVLTHGLADVTRLVRALEGADAAMLCCVGAQVPRLTELLPGRYPGVARVNFAGGAFPQNRLAEVRRLFPEALVFNNYGCAEAMPRLTLRRAEDANDGAVVGAALPGVSLRAGASGELSFRSPYGACAWIDDAGVHEVGPHDWIPSGDLGRVQEDGSIRLEGRATEVFKRYGEKIALPQLASSVRELWPGQLAFYRERDAAGEDGHVLVLAPHADAEAVRSILRAFRQRHPRAHWPLRIESSAELPLSQNGKPDTRAIATLEHKTVHWRQGL
jgi:acyl-CoA synthetase (AMP-forming)/AMP-acid ligase II